MPAENRYLEPILRFVSREPRKPNQREDIDHVTLTWRPRARVSPDTAEIRTDRITREQLVEPVHWIRLAMGKVRS
jgi:hypothetical protein